MKNILLLFLFILSISLGTWGCESPEKTWDEATEDLGRGLSGQGKLEERSWDEVEDY